jgi:hypothetical protein
MGLYRIGYHTIVENARVAKFVKSATQQASNLPSARYTHSNTKYTHTCRYILHELCTVQCVYRTDALTTSRMICFSCLVPFVVCVGCSSCMIARS